MQCVNCLNRAVIFSYLETSTFQRILLQLSSVGRSSYNTRVLNYYDVLEVSPHASQNQIKAAYYRLSKKYHPDVATASSSEKFANLSAAYEVLSNPRNRRQYDNEVMGRQGSRGIGTGGSGLSGSDDYPPEDIELMRFIRRRGSFRDRSGQQWSGPRGRPMFDFDEFYRQHYGESMRQAHQDKMENKEANSKTDPYAQRRDYSLPFYTVVVGISLFIAFKLID